MGFHTRSKTFDYSSDDSSLDRVLDLVAKNSVLVNEPENPHGLWEAIREHRSKEELQFMNKYRRKFGMPEA